MSEQSTAISVQKPAPMETGERGLVLRDLDQMWRFSTAVVKSGLAPSSFKTAEAVMIAIQYGAEVGLSPMQSLQSLAVINGKPSLYGDALPALAWASGLMESLDESIDGQGDSRSACCRVRRKGVEVPIVRTFSVADAKRASLWGKTGPWSSYPDRMLAMRARAFAFRDGFADVLRGLHVSEEVADYQPMTRVASQEESSGFVLPTGEPEKPANDVIDTEAVNVWRVTIGCASTIESLGKLRGEYLEASNGMTVATKAAIDDLFDEQEEKIETVKH